MKIRGDGSPRLRRAAPSALIVLLTIAVRLAYLSIAPANLNEYPLRIDYWADIGHELSEGHGFSMPGPAGPQPTASRVPLYPLLLSAIYRLTGGSDWAAQILQCCLDGCTALLLLLLGRRIGQPRAGMLAALGWALYPPQWRMSQRLWAEPFYAVVSMGLLLAAEAVSRAPTRRRVFVLGILGGALTLSRPIGLFVFLLSLIWLASQSPQAGRRVGLAVVAFTLVLLPWVGRNAVRLNAFVPLDTTGGFNLYVGTLGVQYYVPVSEFEPELRARLEGRSWPETDRILRETAIKRILADPAGHVRRMGRKVLMFFFGFRDPERDRFPTLETLAAGLALYSFAIWGWWRLRRRGIAIANLLLTLPVMMALVHAQIVSQMRMMLPVLPCLLLLAGAGALTLRSGFPGKRTGLTGRLPDIPSGNLNRPDSGRQ